MGALARDTSISTASEGAQARFVLVEAGGAALPPAEFDADAAATVAVSSFGTPTELVGRIEHCLSALARTATSLSEVIYAFGSDVSERALRYRLAALRTIMCGVPTGTQQLLLLLPSAASSELRSTVFAVAGELMAEFGGRTNIRICASVQ